MRRWSAWGPKTEDAIQAALQIGASEDADHSDGSDALAPVRTLGGIVAGIAVASLTAAVALTIRWRRRHTEEAAR